MKATLVDSNVLLDIATDDPRWSAWSSEALEAAGNESPLVIHALIYAEISVGYKRVEDLEEAIPSAIFRREELRSHGDSS